MHVKDNIAYTYHGRCFSRSYRRGCVKYLTGEQFHEVLQFVLESMIPSDADEFDKWKNGMVKVLKKSKGEKAEKRENLMFGEDHYERDFGANDIVVELDF